MGTTTMQNKKAWLAVIAGCSATLLALASFKYQQINGAISAASAYLEPVETVELATAAALQWQPTVTVTAELIAIQNVELSNELPGRIIELGVAPGQRVARGDVLLKLDTREEDADLMAAKADAKLAQLALNRNKRLAKTGAASAEAQDQAQAIYSSTRAQVNRLQAIIDKKTLRAPFDGIVGLHQLSIGQYLDAGTVMTRLVGVDQGVWVDFSLPQHQATLANGDSVTIAAPRLGADNTAATIIARDAWVDTASRNVRYRALPDEINTTLSPGAIVSVTVKLGETLAAVAIPATAVRRDPYGSFVFSLVPTDDDAPAPDRAQRRLVILGGERQQQAIIIEGLTPGERIAGNGSFKLRDGVLVNAVAPDTAAIEAR
jgi:membrane fusion protein (multidrug efflux system)